MASAATMSHIFLRIFRASQRDIKGESGNPQLAKGLLAVTSYEAVVQGALQGALQGPADPCAAEQCCQQGHE